MTHVKIGHDAVVADDLLDPPVFAAIGRELSHGRYESVHARGWDKAWRLTDGTPLRGHPVYYDPKGAFDRPGVRYPTFTAVDDFVDSIRRVAAKHPDVVGVEGVDWVAIFLSPWLYPVGSSLSLHRDGGKYSGAFTFFAHQQWGIHWGGELLILGDEPTGEARGFRGESVGWMEEEVGSALATCVFPRPNRIAFLGPERPHLITRVDANAGEHVRTSIAGFFLRP